MCISRVYDRLPKINQREAVVQLEVSQTFTCKLLRQGKEMKTSYIQNENLQRKRRRDGKDQDVETALKEWFLNIRKTDAHVSFLGHCKIKMRS